MAEITFFARKITIESPERRARHALYREINRRLRGEPLEIPDSHWTGSDPIKPMSSTTPAK